MPVVGERGAVRQRGLKEEEVSQGGGRVMRCRDRGDRGTKNCSGCVGVVMGDRVRVNQWEEIGYRYPVERLTLT